MITCKYVIRFLYSIYYILYMSTRSTVAVNSNTRKRLKKLSALLDLPQGEIIKKALEIYENYLFHKTTKTPIKLKNKSKSKSDSEVEKKKVQYILKESLLQLWEQNPDLKALDLKLMAKNEDFDV